MLILIPLRYPSQIYAITTLSCALCGSLGLSVRRTATEGRLTQQASVEQVWLPVIGRALAYGCLHSAGIDNKTIAEKALFLEGLGLDRKDVANMLGTSHASVSELIRLAKNKSKKGGPKKNASNKKSR